ncbi:GDSL-type esterase/lipase family protein [Phenylobacterium sp.]|jgi:lysophospholipase L1-like esterase|uniref:GDSL-type esterase/lipase family protein n=1 Tax=Phenylobacterium sp. TaxID=1871053 RepID=UPI002E363A9C|nr:GDSL-type esterase/lipase family protein [Phenylobacterium sp.]HEX4712619.1 GDSL-type esterase/lipase family protein [Phenylobacterium sp.]
MRATATAFACLAILAAPACAQPAATPAGPERFAPEIAAFAAADRQHMPAPCGFLFVGSSSIRFWRTLDADMAPLPALNRGFGGSTVADVDYYFDKVVAPYRPRAIVFYAGENDLDAGAAPGAVTADFARFLDLKTKALGETPVYFISLKPSKLRWAQRGAQAEVNAQIQAMAAQRHDLHYVDVVPAMLAGGIPKDIYVADGLHMTPDGYRLWTAVVRPVVQAEAKRPTSCKAS